MGWFSRLIGLGENKEPNPHLAAFWKDLSGEAPPEGADFGDFEQLCEDEVLLVVDWDDTQDLVVDNLDTFLNRLRLDPEIIASAIEKGEAGLAKDGRGGGVQPTIQALDDALATKGMRLLNIDGGGDYYQFALVSADLWRKWHDVSLGRYDHIVQVSRISERRAGRKLETAPRQPS